MSSCGNTRCNVNKMKIGDGLRIYASYVKQFKIDHLNAFPMAFLLGWFDLYHFYILSQRTCPFPRIASLHCSLKLLSSKIIIN